MDAFTLVLLLLLAFVLGRNTGRSQYREPRGVHPKPPTGVPKLPASPVPPPGGAFRGPPLGPTQQLPTALQAMTPAAPPPPRRIITPLEDRATR